NREAVAANLDTVAVHDGVISAPVAELDLRRLAGLRVDLEHESQVRLDDEQPATGERDAIGVEPVRVVDLATELDRRRVAGRGQLPVGPEGNDDQLLGVRIGD